MDLFDKPHYYNEIEDDILLVYRRGTKYHNIFHNHNGYEIYIFLNGNVNFLIEHSCFHLKRGNIAIINPDEYHLAACLDDSIYERITLNLSPSILMSLSTDRTNLSNFFGTRDSGINNIIMLGEDSLMKLLSLINELNDALHSDSFGSDILSRACLSHILYFICNEYIASNLISENIMPKLVSDTIKYVDKHLTEDFSLTDIENELRFNCRYISRQFKTHTGISLKSYIIEKKITLAKSLLASGASVTEACYNSGFNDYSNFIRTFRQYTGTTPGSIKKK